MEPYKRLEPNQEETVVSLPNIVESADGVLNINGAESKRLRLRAVETEKELFLKLMQTGLLRKVVIGQGILSGAIVLLQLILYSVQSSKNWKAIDHSGIGLWGPMFFFSIACILSFISTKDPSGCVLGTALGFQIVSALIGTLIVFVGITSIGMHGYRFDDDYATAGEVTGIISVSGIVLCAIGIVVLSFFISIQFCKATCCGRLQTSNTFLFDVELNK